VWPGLDGADLLAALRTDYTPERTLGYDRARDLLFAHDMRTAGRLRDPYTGFELALPPGEDPSTAAYELGVNTEHVWPQSRGARDEPLRSDLHHLFPVRDEVNSSRGNLPFGEIPDDRAEAWVTLDVSQSRPPASNRERWSERGLGRWEPRDDSKGDVARAVLYVYTVYGPSVQDDGGDAFFSTMRADLLAWNRADPPDAAETARSSWIATQQSTPNPFVLDPTLADRAYGLGVPPDAPASTAPTRPETGTPASGRADVWIAGLHYDNAGDDRGEGVTLAGPPGLRLDGWTLALVNGSGGRVYDTLALTGSLDGSGQTAVAAESLQNGPDGVALVAPDGRVVEFISYEGTVRATEGPAAGTTSVDVGVAESGRGGPGEWIVRDRRGGPWRLGAR
ncbi:MAG TPA: endonuclease, partial [Rubricoccaceae bacterium]